MRTLTLPALALGLVFSLAACDRSEPPAMESGTVVEGDEWVADAAQEGDIELTLPDTPVSNQPAEGAAEASE